jgi:hypothetical protein
MSKILVGRNNLIGHVMGRDCTRDIAHRLRISRLLGRPEERSAWQTAAADGVPSENPIRRRNSRVWPNRGKVGACVMPYDFCPVMVRNWLRARAQLQLEILALRHQLTVLQRQPDRRPRFTSFDRIFWVWLYRLWPGCLDALAMTGAGSCISLSRHSRWPRGLHSRSERPSPGTQGLGT